MTKINLFGFTFTCSKSYEEIINLILRFDARNHSEFPFLITPNVDDIVNWHKPKYHLLSTKFKKSLFVLPDGQPLVWFSKLIGKSLIRRTPGSALFPIIWPKLKERKERVFFILSNRNVCEFYENDYQFCETYSPPYFDASDDNTLEKIIEKCSEKIRTFKPCFVFIGIQFPKQNLIAARLHEEVSITKSPLYLLLGASMEFYSGHLKRSPVFFQKIGLEWFYRFCQQPMRLFKRYFINDLGIFPIFFKELFKNKD